MAARLRTACLLALLFLAAAATARARHSRRSFSAAVSANGTHAEPSTLRDLMQQLSQLRQQSRVLMSPPEMSLIESYLKPDDIMLEWGSGFSTLWFSQLVKQYYSIEHDADWSATVEERVRQRGNVHYKTAPVAKGHKGWGGGIEEGTAAQFAHYVRAVDDFKVERFDKVLIDGRARVVCAEHVLRYLHKDSVVFVHDYSVREGYHAPIEKYYQKVFQSFEGQTLAVFRPTQEALRMAVAGDVATDFEANEPV